MQQCTDKRGTAERPGADHHCPNQGCGKLLGQEELDAQGRTVAIVLAVDGEGVWREFEDAFELDCWHCRTRFSLTPTRAKTGSKNLAPGRERSLRPNEDKTGGADSPSDNATGNETDGADAHQKRQS